MILKFRPLRYLQHKLEFFKFLSKEEKIMARGDKNFVKLQR